MVFYHSKKIRKCSFPTQLSATDNRIVYILLKFWGKFPYQFWSFHGLNLRSVVPFCRVTVKTTFSRVPPRNDHFPGRYREPTALLLYPQSGLKGISAPLRKPIGIQDQPFWRHSSLCGPSLIIIIIIIIIIITSTISIAP